MILNSMCVAILFVPVYLSAFLFICLCVYLSIYLSVFVCVSVCLSAYLSVCFTILLLPWTTQARATHPLQSLSSEISSSLLCSTHNSDCHRNLQRALRQLNEDDITILAQQYFDVRLVSNAQKRCMIYTSQIVVV